MQQKDICYQVELRRIKNFHDDLHGHRENKFNEIEADNANLHQKNMELRGIIVNRENFYKGKIEKLKEDRDRL